MSEKCHKMVETVSKVFMSIQVLSPTFHSQNFVADVFQETHGDRRILSQKIQSLAFDSTQHYFCSGYFLT